jgi:endoglucanase
MQTDDRLATLATSSITYLVRGGGANTVFTVNAASNPRTITVTGREGTSQAVRINPADIQTKDGHAYRIQVTGTLATAGEARLRYEGSGALQREILRAATTGSTNAFTMTWTTTVAQIRADAEGGSNYSIGNVGGSGAQPDMVINGIIITMFCPSADDYCCRRERPADFNNLATLTADQLVNAMGIGWNLGNAFDAHRAGQPIGYALSESIPALEALWLGNDTARIPTQAFIRTVKNAGFDTIRIPVTWYKVADPDNNFQIRASWMNRVREVVNWAMQEDMFVILNVHHEHHIYDGINPSASTSTVTRSRNMVTRFWTQIGTAFNTFNGKLIFEGLNEPRDVSQPNNSGITWYGERSSDPNNPYTPQEEADTATRFTRVNELNQLFVNAVRGTGGNNAGRILMVPAYAASGHRWNSRGPLHNFVRPDDSANPSGARATNKLVLSVHRYEPQPWTLDDQRENGGTVYTEAILRDRVTTAMNEIEERSRNARINMPVILGEWGVTNGTTSLHTTAGVRARYSQHYVSEATARGFRTVWWDNGGVGSGRENTAIFNRPSSSSPGGSIRHQDIITAIRNGRG